MTDPERTTTVHDQTAPRTARQIAEHAIRDAAETINGADVERATSVHRRRFSLTGDQAAALLAEVDELIRSAVITVTWPEPEPYPHCHGTPPVGHACPACGVSEADHG
jgi:hypothetical protein